LKLIRDFKTKKKEEKKNREMHKESITSEEASFLKDVLNQ